MAHQIWEKREIVETDKAIDAIDKINEKLEEEKKKRKFLEKIALLLALFFLVLIIILSIYTKGRIVDSFIYTLQKLESEDQRPNKNVILNCNHKKNMNTPYCLERKAKVKSEWRQTVRARGSKIYQFTLHGNEPKYDRFKKGM